MPSSGWEAREIAPPVAPTASGSIAGAVADPDGRPLADAYVTTDPRGYEATTDAEGRFVIDRLDPGSYAIFVAAEGYGTAWTDGLAVVADEEVEVAIELDRPARTASLRVTVEGPDGLPLAGALVQASTGESVTTDAAGVATLDGLPARIVDFAISDASGELWPRSLDGIELRAGGLTSAQTQLSGRPAPGSRFLGSAACGVCHADIAATHAPGPHGRTLATAVDEPMRAAFAAGTTVALEHGTALLELDGDSAQIVLTADDGDSRTFTVAGVLGDPRGGGVPFVQLGDLAWPLPIAWRAADDERAGWVESEAAVVPWEEPTWLVDGSFTFGPGGAPPPATSADNRCFACHATGFEIALGDDGSVELSTSLSTGQRWGESGVGCERCHGPGSSHASASNEERAFRITRPDRLDVASANEVCGQCHAMTEGSGALPYPWSAEDGLYTAGASLHDFGRSVPNLWASGAAAAAGAQGDELALSPHGEGSPVPLRCIDCHDPHGGTVDPGGQPLPALLRADHRDNAICASCHLSLSFDRDEDALERHWRHWRYDPTGPATRGRCTEGHMPETAARVGFHPSTAAGDLASHRFAISQPHDALDVFDETGLGILEPGTFPPSSCARCHGWNAYLYEEAGYSFVGPTGDPRLRETHAALHRAYVEKFE